MSTLLSEEWFGTTTSKVSFFLTHIVLISFFPVEHCSDEHDVDLVTEVTELWFDETNYTITKRLF